MPVENESMFFRNLLTILAILLLSSFIIFRTGEILINTDLKSPVLGVSKDRISENVWFPKVEELAVSRFTDAPEISAISALFINTETGEILYAKNPNQKLSIASLTKLMTVIIALENKRMEDIYTVLQRATEMEPDEMILIAGEKLTLKELLDGIFLVSANDASEVVAEGTTGRREEFINLMNSKASQLGMNNSIFVNPSGLEEDPENCELRVPCQYSTALDVAIMSRYLINKWPEIVDISSQPYVYIEATANHQDYEMYSGINLLNTYPGVLGLKTGFTPEAGLTLVTLARNGGKEVLGVLLGATNRRDDAKLLLDYSFSKLNN